MDNSYQIDMALIMPEYPIPKYKDGGIHINAIMAYYRMR